MNAMMKPVEMPEGTTPSTTYGLTDMQSGFVRRFAGGMEQTLAAEKAGYSHPATDAWRLLQQPKIIDAINRECAHRLATEGQQAALAFMIKGPSNEKLPGAVRFQCAKWVMEAAGHGLAAQRASLGLPMDDKPLSDMSITELDAFLHAGLNALDHIKGQQMRTIEGNARNVEPDGVGVVAQVVDSTSN